MSLTIVGLTYSPSNTGTEPSGTVSGDLVYAWAINTGGSTIPSTPASWTSRGSDSITLAAGYRSASIQRGGSAPSYTFTNATEVAVLSLRPYNSGGTFKENDNQFSSTTGPQSPAESAFTNPSLVVSVLLIDGAGGNINSIPPGYTNLTGGVNIRAAYKIVSGTSETPGAWVLNAAQSGFAVTSVIPIVLSSTVTSDVTATTKISQVAGASVTVNTKLGLIHVKDITATAKIAAVPHKDVAALAQVSHVQTKNLTGLTEISLGHTKDVTAAGKLGIAGTLDLSAALLIQNIRTLPRRLPAGVARIVPVGRGVARVTRPPAGTARIIGRPAVGTARSKPPGGGSE